jgi:hypothetical protein
MATAPDPLQIDLRVVFETLRGGKATDAWMATWLPATYEGGDAFREAVFAQVGARRDASFKSRQSGGHDLYHDHVAAHVGKRRVALVCRDGAGWDRVTYEALHARCNALAAAWVDRGVEAGDVVALVLPAGIDLAVTLLTALRLGAVPAVVPPLGPAFVRASLEAIGGDHAVSAPTRRDLLGAGAAAALPVSAGARVTGPASHSFRAGEVAARLLAPFGANEGGVTDVTAQVLLDGSVRDAAFVYCLAPDDVLAAPGFDIVRHEPSLLLAALAAGAAHASISEADLAAEPELLGGLGVTVLGLNRRTRDLVLEAGRGLPKGVRAWFRSLTDVVDGDRWERFWQAVPDRKQPNFSVVCGAASGGAALFSPATTAAPGLRVFPAPGLSWHLAELAAGNVPALNDAGMFTILRGEEPDAGCPQAIIGRWGEGHAYAGSLDLGPDAQRYPHAAVRRLLEAMPGVRHATSFIAAGRWLNEARVVVLVFVEGGAGASERPAVELPQIEARIVAEMGRRFLPDRVEVVPLRPRLIEGVVDDAWCRSQYMTGTLSRKARTEMFVRIGRLGYIFARRGPPK